MAEINKPKTGINTTDSVKEVVGKSDSELAKELRDMQNAFGEDDKKWEGVTIPTSMANILGNPYTASFNGVVYTLVAGVEKKLPKAIAEHIKGIINGTV